MNDMDALRQETEQLKNAIRVKRIKNLILSFITDKVIITFHELTIDKNKSSDDSEKCKLFTNICKIQHVIFTFELKKALKLVF